GLGIEREDLLKHLSCRDVLPLVHEAAPVYDVGAHVVGVPRARTCTARWPYLVPPLCDRRRPGVRSSDPWGSRPSAFRASLFHWCRPRPKSMWELDEDKIPAASVNRKPFPSLEFPRCRS